jgi:hypothetical protein
MECTSPQTIYMHNTGMGSEIPLFVIIFRNFPLCNWPPDSFLSWKYTILHLKADIFLKIYLLELCRLPRLCHLHLIYDTFIHNHPNWLWLVSVCNELSCGYVCHYRALILEMLCILQFNCSYFSLKFLIFFSVKSLRKKTTSQHW